MTHLSSPELVDYAEDALDPARAAHAEACAACRRAGEDLRATLTGVAALKRDVPEPSPLYWDQLSARIDERIAAGEGPRAAWWAMPVRVLAPVAACVLVVATIAVVMTPRERTPEVATPLASATTADGDRASDPAIDASTSEMWEVLTAAAADVDWDAAHETAMTLAPSSVDRAVQQLSAAELNELGRLLQTELKRSGD
jgi:hypothetical protein